MKDQTGETGLLFNSHPYPHVRAGSWHQVASLQMCGLKDDGRKAWSLKTSKSTSFNLLKGFSPDMKMSFQPGESVMGTISFYKDPDWYVSCIKYRTKIQSGRCEDEHLC